MSCDPTIQIRHYNHSVQITLSRSGARFSNQVGDLWSIQSFAKFSTLSFRVRISIEVDSRYIKGALESNIQPSCELNR